MILRSKSAWRIVKEIFERLSIETSEQKLIMNPIKKLFESADNFSTLKVFGTLVARTRKKLQDVVRKSRARQHLKSTGIYRL